MKKIKKLIAPFIVTLALIFVAVFALSTWEPYTLWSIQMNPTSQLQRSFQKTVDALCKGAIYEIPEAVTQAFATGAIGVDLTTAENTTMENMLYLRDNGIVSIGTANMGDEFLSGYGFWLNEEVVALETSGPVSSNTYGLRFDTLKKDLENSALLDYLGVSYDEACAYIDSVLDVLQTDKAKDKAQNNKTQMAAQLTELLNSCPVTVQTETLNIENEMVETYHISYTISPAQICDAAEILNSWINSSEVEGEGQPIKETLGKWEDTILQSNVTAIIDFYLHSKTQVIIQADCRMDWMQNEKPGTIAATISLGENPSQSICYTASITTKEPGMAKEEITLEYHRSNAHNLPERKLIISNNGESMTLADLQINEVTQTFEFSIMDYAYSMMGTCKKEDGKFEVQSNIADIGYLTVTFYEKAEMPSVPTFTNICNLSAEELEALLAEQGPEEPDYNWENNITMTICDGDGSIYFLYYIGEYNTVADLMIAECLADLDEDGRIARVYVFGEQVPGEKWKIYVKDELYEGSLYDLLLYSEVNIDLIGMAPN